VALGDQLAVPGAAVLLVEGDELTGNTAERAYLIRRRDQLAGR
jgi:hypothetical protein